MIREGIALFVLGTVFVLLLCNISFYTQTTDELIALVDEAETLVKTQDYPAAQARLLTVARRWADLDGYTHILIRHSEISEMTDAIYAALGDVASEDALRAEVSLARLREELNSTAAMERLTAGSIF